MENKWIRCPACGSKTRDRIKKKLSTLLSEMQTGNIDSSQEFTSNNY